MECSVMARFVKILTENDNENFKNKVMSCNVLM